MWLIVYDPQSIYSALIWFLLATSSAHALTHLMSFTAATPRPRSAPIFTHISVQPMTKYTDNPSRNILSVRPVRTNCSEKS